MQAGSIQCGLVGGGRLKKPDLSSCDLALVHPSRYLQWCILHITLKEVSIVSKYPAMNLRMFFSNYNGEMDASATIDTALPRVRPLQKPLRPTTLKYLAQTSPSWHWREPDYTIITNILFCSHVYICQVLFITDNTKTQQSNVRQLRKPREFSRQAWYKVVHCTTGIEQNDLTQYTYLSVQSCFKI